MHDVELRIRALRRRGLVEFFKVIQLPFVPPNWLNLHEGPVNGPDGLQVQEVNWSISEKRFVCQLSDDIDSQFSLDDNTEALIRSYRARGWKVRANSELPHLYEAPA